MEVVKFDKFSARDYQIRFLSAVQNKKFMKYMLIWSRRGGKDYACWEATIEAAIQYVGLYLYCLPTSKQARSVIWLGMTNTGERFIDMIPSRLIKSINNTEMLITLINNSQIQLIGSNHYDNSILGRNARWIVFSEYGISDERAYKLAASPILKANGGVVIINSTPRGKNHLYDLFQIAKNSEDWFVDVKTVNDIKHISVESIQREIESGEISEDLALQEYFCSFDLGVEGSYYAKYIDKLRLEGRITDVPWEPSYKVNTAWDIGWNDSTCIIFYQTQGNAIRIIDFYESNFKPIEHYCKVLSEKPYLYGKHFVGHDIMVHEQGSGLTRYDMYKNLGTKFELRDGKSATPNVRIEDGIERVRAMFARLWIDEKRCAHLIKCLENYHQEYDNKRKVYKGIPLHNWASHAADAARYMALTVDRVKEGTTKEEWNKHYQDAYYNDQSHLPSVFRSDLPKS